MFRRIKIALTLLMYVSPVLAHETVLLDARLATPGPRLKLIELPQDSGQQSKKYRLDAEGLPKGVVFNIWAKDFGHSFHEIASGFQLNSSGEFVSLGAGESGKQQKLAEMIFEPGLYPLGALWEVAMVSDDRAIKAFAGVIPYPIKVSDGPCSISVQMISQLGDRFLITGEGFFPGSDVMTLSRYSGRVYAKPLRISAAGKLPPQVISHAALGEERTAQYKVTSRHCTVTFDYEWGRPALARR
jgi:hypothetical protein